MNLYFFFKNESSSNWYDCTIEAWQENNNTYMDGKPVSSFNQLERLKLHICKHPTDTEERKKYHAARFDHDYGEDSSLGHNAKNLKDFIRDQTVSESSYRRMTQIDHRTFQRFKKAMIKIYREYPAVNYTSLLLKEAPLTRILF